MMPLRAMSGLLSQALQPVSAIEDPLRPRGVGKVPVDGHGKAFLEADGGGPAKLAPDLAGIDGVAPVVAGAVADEGDLGCPRLAVAARTALVEQAADGLDHLDAPAFGVGANVVDLTHAANLQHAPD